MATAQELRDHLQDASSRRTEALKAVLNAYFEYSFIKAHKPFRAVIGNNECRPVPIYRDFPGHGRTIYVTNGPKVIETVSLPHFEWPVSTEEELREELEGLGFVLTEHLITIAVHPLKKDEPMSFAQEWVKKINDSYSAYCDSEKKEAEKAFPSLLAQLRSSPYTVSLNSGYISGYVLYPGFTFKGTEYVSTPFLKFIRRLFREKEIEAYFVDGKYKGIRAPLNP